jgi:sarcosine oxidase
MPALSAPSLPQVAYFAPRSGAVAALPIFIAWGDDMVYGLPVPAGGPRAGLYKVAQHVPGPALGAFDPTDPAPFAVDDPALLAPLTDAVARLLPTLDPRPVATERCVYDNTSDADFVLERVGRVVVGCGTSGHAFKFGPLLGELLADLAEGTRPAVDLSRFALARSAAPPHRAEPGPVQGGPHGAAHGPGSESR